MSKLNFLFISVLALFLFVKCQKDDTIVDVDNPTVSSNCPTSGKIYESLSGSDLKQKLRSCYTPQVNFDYSEARKLLYKEIDVINGKVQTIYTNAAIDLQRSGTQSYISAASEKGINCEHVFPQSQGAGNEPAKSDLYHIYPELKTVNSDRGFNRFGEISNPRKWYYKTQIVNQKPSDAQNWAKGSETMWEPSDDKKGDIARSVFYFAVIYENRMNANYFNSMKDVLLKWHKQDPVSQQEKNRATKISLKQKNLNPFIIDASLAERVFE